MIKIKMKKEIATIFIFLLVLSNVSAFGIGFAYHENNPLKISAGETRDIEMSLQNMAGPEEVNLKSRIIKGGEIIKLIDESDIYSIPVGGEKMANFQISIPEGTKEDLYSIEVEFITVSQNEEGTFNLGSSVGKNFEVYVIEEKSPVKNISGNFVWIILGIVAIAASVIFALKRKGIILKNRLKFK